MLYPTKTFGFQNKNIISYSMVSVLYVEVQLKHKVERRTLFIRKNGRTENGQRNVRDTFVTRSRDGEARAPIVVFTTNPSISRSTNIVVMDFDSTGLGVCLNKDGGLETRFKEF